MRRASVDGVQRETAANILESLMAAGEFMSLAGWREDAGFRVFHFAVESVWPSAGRLGSRTDKTHQ
jgi:hypothetical protein